MEGGKGTMPGKKQEVKERTPPPPAYSVSLLERARATELRWKKAQHTE